MTLSIDVETYREYKGRVMELSNQRTRVEGGEYVAELRSSEEIAAEIEALTSEQVADIRTVAEVDETSIDHWKTADEKLE